MSISKNDPILRLVMTLRVDCMPFEKLGDMGKGIRRIMLLTGGTFEIPAQTGGTFSTPAVRGVVLGGYDWQILHSERCRWCSRAEATRSGRAWSQASADRAATSPASASW